MLTLDEIIQRLSGLTHETVMMDADQVASFIGHARVAEMFDFAANMVRHKGKQRRSRRSLVPREKQFSTQKIARFNRIELLNELKAARDKNARTTDPVSN